MGGEPSDRRGTNTNWLQCTFQSVDVCFNQEAHHGSQSSSPGSSSSAALQHFSGSKGVNTQLGLLERVEMLINHVWLYKGNK